MQEDRGDRPGRARLFTGLALTGLGLPGIVSLLPALPEVSGVPRAALLINPVILLALASFLGAGLAPRCGFRSSIAERIEGRSAGLLPDGGRRLLAWGLVLGIAVTLADHALAPLWQARPAFPPSLVEAWSPTALVIGLLYGGILEEILMRWGLTSLLVWVLWRIFARGADGPPQGTVLIGLAMAALVFAASHLPALVTAGAQLDGPLLARTIGFNLALGLAFGWLFVSRSLESAMFAHIGFHLGVACIALPMKLAL